MQHNWSCFIIIQILERHHNWLHFSFVAGCNVKETFSKFNIIYWTVYYQTQDHACPGFLLQGSVKYLISCNVKQALDMLCETVWPCLITLGYLSQLYDLDHREYCVLVLKQNSDCVCVLNLNLVFTRAIGKTLLLLCPSCHGVQNQIDIVFAHQKKKPIMDISHNKTE